MLRLAALLDGTNGFAPSTFRSTNLAQSDTVFAILAKAVTLVDSRWLNWEPLSAITGLCGVYRGPVCLPKSLEADTRDALSRNIVSRAKLIWGGDFESMDETFARDNGKCPMTEREVMESLLVSAENHDAKLVCAHVCNGKWALPTRREDVSIGHATEFRNLIMISLQGKVRLSIVPFNLSRMTCFGWYHSQRNKVDMAWVKVAPRSVRILLYQASA